jgi:citrate synthase
MIEDLEEVEVVLRGEIEEKNGEIEGLENRGRELREKFQKKEEIEVLENSGREFREELQALKKTNGDLRKVVQEKNEEITLLLQASSYNRMQKGALKTTATHELAKSKRLNEENDEMKSKVLLIKEIEEIEDTRMSVSMLEDDSRQRKRAQNVNRFVHGWYGEEIEERKFQISYNMMKGQYQCWKMRMHDKEREPERKKFRARLVRRKD